MHKRQRTVLILLALIVVILALALLSILLRGEVLPTQEISEMIPYTAQTNMIMTLQSSAFQDNQAIPAEYTCDGEGKNPALEFLNIPDGAKSLALIMEDPDVPKTIREDGMWNHWLVWDMAATTREIRSGATAPGTVGQNTSGIFGYTPPCPPDREHRYVFTLYALDAKMRLNAEATKEELIDAMDGHILETAQLIGVYNRH